ncbi:hypothetical protein V5799_014491 [Amblyomma americanum]|uniref:Uncharacterized protein n=1 Tax=Amblyomma americanum TaxID=6943 RepID=A0AAQ4E2V8_AMBAM
MVKAKSFQKYDWGRKKNVKIYGQRRPPQYDLKKVTAPVAIYWGDGDVLTTPRDVKDLAKRLPNVVLVYKVPVPGFTHLDFGWSFKAWKHLYKKMLQMMKTYAKI